MTAISVYFLLFCDARQWIVLRLIFDNWIHNITTGYEHQMTQFTKEKTIDIFCSKLEHEITLLTIKCR